MNHRSMVGLFKESSVNIKKIDISVAMPAIVTLVEGDIINLERGLDAAYMLGFKQGEESGRKAEAQDAKHRISAQQMGQLESARVNRVI